MKWYLYFFWPLFTLSKPMSLNSVCKESSRASAITLIDGFALKYDIDRIKREVAFHGKVKVEFLEIFYPNAVWLPEEEKYLVVARVYVNEYNSFVYASFFTKHWNQILTRSKFQSLKLPSIIHIPIPDMTEQWTGPEDPRMYVSPENEIFIIFNQISLEKVRKMHIYSVKDGRIFNLTLSSYDSIDTYEGTFQLLPATEKNWTPLVTPSEMFFVYTLSPYFQVIKCDTQLCNHTQGHYSVKRGKIKSGPTYQKFGETNYYFTFSYTQHFFPERERASYRPSITLIYADPETDTFSYVYTSNLLFIFDQFGYEPYAKLPLPKDLENLEFSERIRVIIISSIVEFDFERDQTVVLGFADDEFPFVATVKGIRELVSQTIEDYHSKFYNLYA